MPPQPNDSDLDVVQHPTLGTLKFPKSMSMDERNASIDRLIAQPEPNLSGGSSRLQLAARGLPANLTQPTQFERERQGAFQTDYTDPRAVLGAAVLHAAAHPIDTLSAVGSKARELLTPEAPRAPQPSPAGSTAADIADY